MRSTKTVSVTATVPSLPAQHRDTSKADSEDKTIKNRGRRQQDKTLSCLKSSRNLVRTFKETETRQRCLQVGYSETAEMAVVKQVLLLHAKQACLPSICSTFCLTSIFLYFYTLNKESLNLK